MKKAYNLALILLLSLILDQQTSGTAKNEGLIKLQAWLKGLGKNYSLKQLKNLKKLDLSGKQLKALPPVIIKLKALIYLNLSNNQLRTLPPEIGKLKALTTLDIRSNRLNKLPKEIIEVKNLFILAKGNLLSKTDMERIKKLYITAKRGKKIFRIMGCTGCHDTKVGMATVPFPSRPHMASLSDADFRDCILNGRKGTAMAAYKGKVSDEEIKAIRKYIITYKGK